MDGSGGVIGANIDLGLDGQPMPDDQEIESIFREKATKHADDAIDFEDMDELADEEETAPKEAAANADDFFNDLLGENEEMSAQQQADAEFDDMFGGESMPAGAKGNRVRFDDTNAHLDDLQGHDMMFDDDGLDDLVGESFFDGNDGGVSMGNNHMGHSAMRHTNDHKRSLESEVKRQEKRRKLALVVQRLEQIQTKRNLRYYFPTFSPNKPYNFHLFFLPPPKFYRYQTPPIAQRDVVKPMVPTKILLEVSVDTRKLFRSRKRVPEPAPVNVTAITQDDLEFIEELERKRQDTRQFIKPLPFLQSDWYDNDKFDGFSKEQILATTDWDDSKIVDGGVGGGGDVDYNLLEKGLADSDDEDIFDDEAIFSGQIASKEVELDMNDPNLIFIPSREETDQSKAVVPTLDKLLSLKFNFSNDKSYEVLKQNYNTKVRLQLSNLTIEHSVPALRLQAPYYKVKLNKDEARNFHRQRLHIRPGTLISFSKLRVRKKKKDKGKTFQEIFSRTLDLTLADNCNLVAMEYLEEYPYILSNFGMGLKIINYYRKELADDTSRPKLSIGETHVLGPEDRLPFWNFGEVGPGDFVPALYNNMVRAPIYRHQPHPTDFLFIRLQGTGSHPKYFLRTVAFNYALGNSFPAVEIPAPHLRKVTNTLKNRLKMIVYRLMNKNGAARVMVKDVLRHFPDQNDMQNRQRLKEFMEYQRQGDDQGYWKMKNQNNDHIPPEEEIRLMITPEDCALLDAMQHGQQMLEDTYAIYGGDENRKAEAKREREERKEKKRLEEERGDDEEEDGAKQKKTRRPRDPDAEIDLDEELTPWLLTRNFVTANQTKLMLQLVGEGDPTGIGIGFSFMRATQRQPFQPLHPPPKELMPKNNTAAYQQKLYDAEIKRIWYTQRKSLVDHGDTNFDLAKEIYQDYPPVSHSKTLKPKIHDDKMVGKVLKITRRVRDENGVVQRKIETITDPRVIRAYIRKRKQIDYDLLKNLDLAEVRPGTNEEMNEIKKQAIREKIASLEKRAKMKKTGAVNKEAAAALAAARAAAAAAGSPGESPVSAAGSPVPEPVKTKGVGKGKLKMRKCTSCGEYGHIKTKKTCPNFFKNHPDAGVPEIFGAPSQGASASLAPENAAALAFALTNQAEEEF